MYWDAQLKEEYAEKYKESYLVSMVERGASDESEEEDSGEEQKKPPRKRNRKGKDAAPSTQRSPLPQPAPRGPRFSGRARKPASFHFGMVGGVGTGDEASDSESESEDSASGDDLDSDSADSESSSGDDQ